MHILHTADVHLNADRPETVTAVETVLDEAADREVDLVTIGGDLFDRPQDADALRAEVRDMFRDNPFHTIAIPGNHDADVFANNLRFGADLEVLAQEPFATKRIGDIDIVGVPFTGSMDDDLFRALQSQVEPDRTQLLLLHCTLDIGFRSADTGEEGTYLPVTQATLNALGYDYILAGHIHSTAREVPLADGGTFVYPGSPVSHATDETGKRAAIHIDTDADTVSSVPLETFYYDEYAATIRPGEEDDTLGEIERWVSARADDDCEPSIRVDGFVDREEDAFWQALRSAAAPVDPVDATRSVSHVLEHPLYERFANKLEEQDDIAHLDHTRMQVIRVIADLLTQRKVQPA